MAAKATHATIDHETIRQWVEANGGRPAHVEATGSGEDPGILRIDFPGYSGAATLAPLPWETFFEWFDKNELAFLYQPGKKDSRFSKLVSRDSIAEKGGVVIDPKRKVHALRLLESQHREVEGLFQEYEEAKTSRDKQELFEQIADALAAHARIEEDIFYPEVLAKKTEDELREAVEEHLAIKRLIADLLEMKPSDEQFDSKMRVLQEQVEHHVEEEENDLFKLLKGVSQEQLRDMGSRMKTQYEQLMKKQPRSEVPKETARAAQL